MEDYTAEIRKEAKNSIQPYLLLYTGQSGLRGFIQGDGHLLQLPKDSPPLVHFDILYKFFYVFNLQFPPLLETFFSIIESYMYAIRPPPPGTPSLLWANISNMKDFENYL